MGYPRIKRSVESLTEADLRGKRVLVRVDMNVPMDRYCNIIDDTRIKEAVPTIKYLIKNRARVILITRLGYPLGKYTNKYSLSLLVPRLSELLDFKVKIASDCIGDCIKKAISKMVDRDVLLLENLRFHEGEVNSDVQFVDELESLADLYVNEAFGTSHALYGSNEGIAENLKPAVAGILFRKELDFLIGVLEEPKKPFVAIVGGASLADKSHLIPSLFQKNVDMILLGGGIAFTFLKAQGYNVAGSLVEMDQLDMAESIISQSRKNNVKLLFPVDVIMAKKFCAKAMTKVVRANEISKDNWTGLDIGPEAIDSFCETLDTAKTILWNGPMGVYEFDEFVNGTKAIAEKLAELTAKGVTTIIAGDNTVEAVKNFGFADKMSHVSTGRGASIELLMGCDLPGLCCLDDEKSI